MFNWNYADLLARMPNVVTGSAHAACIALAYVFILVPRVGSHVADALFKLGDQYTKDSQIRADKWVKSAEDIRTRDLQIKEKAAERYAEEAKKQGAAKQKTAEKNAEAEGIQSKTKVEVKKVEGAAKAQGNINKREIKANAAVNKSEEKAGKEIVATRQSIDQKSIDETMKHRVQLMKIEANYENIEKNLQIEVEKLKREGTHLKQKTEIERDIITAADKTKDAASTNTEIANVAKTAVDALTNVEKELYVAHQAFYEALNLHQEENNKAQLADSKQSNNANQTTEKGIIQVEKENTLAAAYLTLYKTEQKAATKLDEQILKAKSNTQINQQQKTKIAEILPQQLEARKAYLSVSLAQKLAELDHKALNTLYTEVSDEIAKQSTLIKSDPKTLDHYEKDRTALTELSEKINTILSLKAQPNKSP